jgi:RNA polymerase sigma-70 factor (ECF subfamily)
VDDLKWLIARQIPHLRRFAMALARNPDDADELVQDCLERALVKRRLWSRKGPLRSWLFSLLYRTYIDKRRGRQRKEIPTDPAVINASNVQWPNQERRVECRDIGEALKRLPDDQRNTILLVALEGFTYDEAAEIMKVPIGTIRSRLSRGRKALQEIRRSDGRPHFLRRVK